MKTEERTIKLKEEAREKIIEMLEFYDGYYCDLHDAVFNTDYYIVGNYQARQFLESFGVFEAIDIVMEYEKSNFGEIYTEISDPEKLANMLFYVIGADVISEMAADIELFDDNWNERATEKTNRAIIKKLKAMTFYLRR